MNPASKDAAADRAAGRSTGPHPSFFLLDRLHLAALRHLPDAETEPVQAHIQDCERCRSYVQSLATADRAPVPRWVHAPERPSRWARLWTRWMRPVIVLPTLGALALGVVLLGARGLASDEARLRPVPTRAAHKGGSSVQVYIKRGEQVLLWDGKAALKPRDRIRLEIAGAGFAQVTVATPPPGGGSASLASLYAGALRRDAPTLLPASWTLDDRREAELLYVILSHQPLPSGPLDLAQLRQRIPLAVHSLHLAKEPSP